MPLVHLEAARYAPAGRELFRDLSWSIEPGRCVGLVGANGVGKSSLLRIVCGELPLDAGQRSMQRGTEIGYLPQILVAPPNRSLLELALEPPRALAEIQTELARIEERLGDPGVYSDEARLTHHLERQSRLVSRYEELGGPSHPGRVRGLLERFGLGASIHSLPAEMLSGGQKKLAALAALACGNPDLLLLDEPDNHLDLDAKRRLEAFLRDFPGAVVIVSHDRSLLDACVDQIAELDGGRLSTYSGTYSVYAEERRIRRLQQQRHYAAQQKEIARIEAAIRRFELWASLVVNERHAKQARSRRRGLERMEDRGELVARVATEQRMSLELPGGRGSRRALVVEDLAIEFDDRLVFESASLEIQHGERVGLVGANGCGKSVLLRAVLGQLAPLAGEIRIGAGTRVGHYAQEHETLEEWLDRTPVDFVRDGVEWREEQAVAFLLRFLFRYEQTRQPIRAFSGGERSRLQLARLVVEEPNLLVLDEPTNNLDIPSAEVLEEALEDFEGSVLIVSHDRYFLDRVVDRIAVLTPEGIEDFRGGYSEYLEQKFELEPD